MNKDGYLASGLNAVLDEDRYWDAWNKLEVLPVLAPRGVFLPCLRPFMVDYDVLILQGVAEGSLDRECTQRKIALAKERTAMKEDDESPWADMR